MKPVIVTATDTGVGKTVIAAMLTLALNAIYWKPIQSGNKDGTDRQRVAVLTGLPPARFRPEAYVLSEPLSPHRAAEIDAVEIDPDTLALPQDVPAAQTLVIEGVGGVLVPVTRKLLQIDLFARWNAPVVLVARTSLGTINHTLLSLEALNRRSIPVLGVIFAGEANDDSERTIVELGKTRRLGRLPALPALNAAALTHAFATYFDVADFEGCA
jgi:dethiobiotin synthase